MPISRHQSYVFMMKNEKTPVEINADEISEPSQNKGPDYILKRDGEIVARIRASEVVGWYLDTWKPHHLITLLVISSQICSRRVAICSLSTSRRLLFVLKWDMQSIGARQSLDRTRCQPTNWFARFEVVLDFSETLGQYKSKLALWKITDPQSYTSNSVTQLFYSLRSWQLHLNVRINLT